jgi:hypothetical protein
MTFVARLDWYGGTLGMGTRLGQDGWLVYASRLRRYQRLPPLVRNRNTATSNTSRPATYVKT